MASLTNYIEPVPGTDVTCYLGQWDNKPETWAYSLWTGRGNGDESKLIATGYLDIPQPDTYTITPQQVARIAFLLDVEYPAKGE